MIKSPIKKVTSEFEERINEMATSEKSPANVTVTGFKVYRRNGKLTTYVILTVELDEGDNQIVELTRCWDDRLMEIHLFGGPLLIRTKLNDADEDSEEELESRYVDKHPEWEFMRTWVCLFGCTSMLCDLICTPVQYTTEF